MELAVVLVPEHMAPDIRRYIASQGRVFVGDISLMTGDTQSAMKSYLKEAADSLAHWYQASYKAANWVNVGRTAGRGKKSTSHKHLIPAKDIWLYPLRKKFSTLLCK